MKKIKNFVLAFILMAMMALNINAADFITNPVGAIPEGKEKIGQVLVIVEDTIESSDSPIEPRGAIIDGQWVDLYESDTMMNLIVRAANEREIEVEGAESNYIGGVDGLKAFDRGFESGWMLTLNDWFINAGGDDFSTETTIISLDGDLQDQDVIRVMYTLNYGEDLGGTWDNNDKSLKAINFNQGTLDQDFESSVHEYELEVADSTDSLLVTPSATNKNFQCRTFVYDVEKRFTKALAIEEGSVIKVTCGDPAWATMNSGSESVAAETYIFTIKYLEDDADEFVANPIGAIPEKKAKIGQVLVSVEDTLPGTPEPRGTIIAGQWVDLYESDTMLNLIVRAANKKEIEVIVKDSMFGQYIGSIDGLEEGARGGWSGWTTTLNDWFIHQSVSSFTTESTYTSLNGDLQDKDIIKVMYSISLSDLGGTWDNNDKSLKSIKFDKGNLNKKFKSDVYEYELKVAKGTKSVLVTPSATNKNFQCRIFVGDKEYRRTNPVSIKEGSTIKVICGDSEWATQNYGSEQEDAKTYTFKVKYSNEQVIDKDKDESENKEYGKLPLNGYDLSLLVIILLVAGLSSGTYFVLRRK